MAVLLRNCRIVPELTQKIDGISVDEKEDITADIKIENGKFVEILKSGSFKETANCDDITVIDIKGSTVLPGLFELHTHLTLDSTDYSGNLMYDVPELLVKSYEFAKEYLKQGYTTVRDCGGRGNVTRAINMGIANGTFIGPRIISCGRIITPTETGNSSFGDMYIEADGPMEFRKACREQFKLGNDFIKVMCTGAFLNDAGDPGMQIITLEELKECVVTASMKKSYVAAHCHSDAGIRCAIKAGVRTIEHGVFIEPDTVELLKNTKNCFLIPTGAIGMECLSDENQNATEDILNKSKLYEEKEKNAINYAYRSGLKMGFGSDIDMEAFKRIPGYEFVARKKFYDFENVDILKQATINSAEILGVADDYGSIETGKVADMIVVDGKPDKDIYCMQKPLKLVMKEGIIVDDF
ncbi:MAG: amidohydrolase family protein [[Eubacterium] brachy]|nr:amidohydrolase family protein [[Eubacterium] brachy]